MSAGDRLRPCPFCGNKEARLVSFVAMETKWYYAKCDKCHAQINRPVCDKREAVETWNRIEGG